MMLAMTEKQSNKQKQFSRFETPQTSAASALGELLKLGAALRKAKAC
jgi:hypothetical protein